MNSVDRGKAQALREERFAGDLQDGTCLKGERWGWLGSGFDLMGDWLDLRNSLLRFADGMARGSLDAG